MNIVKIFEEMAKTVHHKINFNKLLKEESPELKQILQNKDTALLKSLFPKKGKTADRTTIFDF